MIATSIDRVPDNTSDRINERIRKETDRNIAYYTQQDTKAIQQRLRELAEEWDIERAIEANAATATMTGFVLGTVVSRKWFLLPAVVGAFLMQHAISGWCPPVPVMRRMGFRTAYEIDRERYALMAALDGEHAD